MEDRLFATLDPSTRSVYLGEGRTALLTDTVGFIRKLPHHLVASFRSTLAEAGEADVLLHVVDASHPERDGHARVVAGVLEELELGRRARITVYNKVDLLSPDDLLALKKAAASRGPWVAYTSALTPSTLEPLKRELVRRHPERPAGGPDRPSGRRRESPRGAARRGPKCYPAATKAPPSGWSCAPPAAVIGRLAKFGVRPRNARQPASADAWRPRP